MFKKYRFNPFTSAPSARGDFLHYRRLHHLKRLNDSHRFPADFILIPDVFNSQEQHTLLTASLAELDRMGSRRAHRRMKQYKSEQDVKDPPTSIMNVFLPDHLYEFEEGHYDGVIRAYREMHLSAWRNEGVPILLDRLKSFGIGDIQNVQTHLLHLASDGYILPHIDDLDASGSWIMGISLGAERIMRLESIKGEELYEVLLPTGSVYLQRDSVRFGFRHSIILRDEHESHKLIHGQRLSIMLRDHKWAKEITP